MGSGILISSKQKKKTKAEIRADIQKQIVAITSKRAAAHANILELHQHTEDTWQELRTSTETRQPVAFMMAVAVTGQNPASSEPAAKALLEKLA